MASESKAWIYTHPSYPTCLQSSTFPLPDQLSDTEIQVRIKSAALNPVDIQLMNVPIWNLPYMGFPKGIGKDFSGTILKAGQDSGFSQGDEVFGLFMSQSRGTLTEVAVMDVKASVVLKKPKDWSWNQAAALPLVWLTARTCIARVEPYIGPNNKKIAILGGSSATGMYTTYIAHKRGWTILSTCSSRNAEFVTSMGAATVVDYTTEDVPSRVRDFAPDAIIDCVGGTGCIGIAKRYVTIVGDKTSRLSMGGPALYLTSPRMVLRKLLGMLGWWSGEVYDCVILEQNADFLREATDIPVEKILIDSTFDYDELKDAFERLNTGRARGKVVVEVDRS
jgi:NADPH:quinone reductase-like Zn-dependent oxidoreductase